MAATHKQNNKVLAPSSFMTLVEPVDQRPVPIMPPADSLKPADEKCSVDRATAGDQRRQETGKAQPEIKLGQFNLGLLFAVQHPAEIDHHHREQVRRPAEEIEQQIGDLTRRNDRRRCALRHLWLPD